MKITNRYTGNIIFEDAASTIRETLINAINAGVNLRNTDLRNTDLSGADLRNTDLRNTDLSGADLRGANLRGADLRNTDLRNTNLRGADLRNTDLRNTDLSGADLRGANLSGANLRGADLRGANLSGAKGKDTISELTLSRMRIVPSDGSFIGWKKLLDGSICKLQIPEDAKRCGGVVGRKCRASKALVLEGRGKSSHSPEFIYEPGKIVEPEHPYCDDEFLECESGIHFYITKAEAEAHI